MMGLVTIAIGPVYEAFGAHAYFVMAGLGVMVLAGLLFVAMRWDGGLLIPEEDTGAKEQDDKNGD